MGEVWLAEQLHPVRRHVAFKVIKPGLDTAQVIARFEAERQALALMDHPAIAKVFDAGTTAEGRPYVAMEYVRGEALTSYADRHHLTINERLELFAQICDGVHHAHQKGIIHRDLKPSNILLTLQDDRPVPKIIDFGIAKAMSQPLTEHTLYTSLGGFIGTREYMSPEQAAMGGVDVDTRTDVYALGVVLYELLTGVLPFDREVFTTQGIDEIRRIIREVVPRRPSTRITQLRETPADMAERRGLEPPRLAALLRGDLDWITMKALEKDRARRYGSASDFAADIRRHLAKQPVSAGPPGAMYRSRKFVERHRVGVSAAAALLLLLITFAVVMAVQSQRIARERDRANMEARRANHEAAAARQVADFLASLFKVSDPSEARGATLTAREILDKGSRDIDKTLAKQPEVKARLQSTIAAVYTSLGLYDEARPHLEAAAATQRTLLGEEHLETLTTVHQLADVYWYQGRLPEAERLYRSLADRRARVLGREDPSTLRTNKDLASVYILAKRWEEAERLAVQTLTVQRRVLGPAHEDTLSSLNNLQALYYRQQRYAEAEPIAREVYQARRATLGAEHPETLLNAHNLATVCDKLGRYEEAERLYLDTIAVKRRVLGPSHPDTANTEHALAVMYQRQRLFEKAESLALVAHETFLSRFGEQHVQTRRVVNDIVKLYEAWGKTATAVEWRKRAAGSLD